MKTIGILGGMSDQATVEYYRLINSDINSRLGGWNTAEVIISSVNFGRIEQYVRGECWDEAGEYLTAKALGLEKAGAHLLICVSNTMHRVAEVFTGSLSIPFIHIVDPTAEAIQCAGLKTMAILGTKPVMSASYIQKRYADRYGISLISPNETDQLEIDRIIFEQLVRGNVQEESKKTYLGVIDRLQAAGAEGLILGCTEIFMLVSQRDRPGFPMFNTTSIHAARAVEVALDQDSH
jgi:aspartate racemase